MHCNPSKQYEQFITFGIFEGVMQTAGGSVYDLSVDARYLLHLDWCVAGIEEIVLSTNDLETSQEWTCAGKSLSETSFMAK